MSDMHEAVASAEPPTRTPCTRAQIAAAGCSVEERWMQCMGEERRYAGTKRGEPDGQEGDHVADGKRFGE